MIFKSSFDNVEYYFPQIFQEAMELRGMQPIDFEDWDLVSQSSVSAYIDGRQIPNLRTIYRIAEFLEVSIDWLCGLGEERSWSDTSMQEQLKAPWVK